MIVKNPKNYKFIKFEQSKARGKKYDAILMNKNTGSLKRVSFGSNTHQQYKDMTGLGLYTHLDHNDKQRRKNYRLRHHGEDKNVFSSGYFSMRYLW